MPCLLLLNEVMFNRLHVKDNKQPPTVYTKNHKQKNSKNMLLLSWGVFMLVFSFHFLLLSVVCHAVFVALCSAVWISPNTRWSKGLSCEPVLKYMYYTIDILYRTNIHAAYMNLYVDRMYCTCVSYRVATYLLNFFFFFTKAFI